MTGRPTRGSTRGARGCCGSPSATTTHAQVNRGLLDEFAAVLAEADWDVALLQECPPRWSEPLARATGAEAHRELTSRNSLAALRSLAADLNPDLIGSNEGGSNLTLVRGRVLERRGSSWSRGPRPERRVMVFTRAVPVSSAARSGSRTCTRAPAPPGAQMRSARSCARRDRPRMGRRRPAALRRRPQPAPERKRRLRPAGDGPRADRADGAGLARSPARRRPRRRRAARRVAGARGARSRPRRARSGSPITRPSPRRSPEDFLHVPRRAPKDEIVRAVPRGEEF